MLKEAYCDHIAQCIKTVAVDNGSEFADFVQCEEWDGILFRPPLYFVGLSQNERLNDLFGAFAPKGTSQMNYPADYTQAAADELNARPRRKMGYWKPEKLFDAFLDRICAVDSKLVCPC